jgi:hypothetical protein
VAQRNFDGLDDRSSTKKDPPTVENLDEYLLDIENREDCFKHRNGVLKPFFRIGKKVFNTPFPV